MWLIDTTTFKLKFFASTHNVTYAILSHTWNEGEVTFQDIKDLSQARRRPGWTKIEWTCHLALAHDIKYAWVDTCCIDKMSSAELSEAINSMFNWYRGSKVCFVYLQDFPSSSLGLEAVDHETPGFQIALRDCRWFRRGWTLQELIASDMIEFYNDTWACIGDKPQLLPLLSTITGIDDSVLDSIDNLWSTSVGTRMSWASTRETTRIEDTAYCLLGIFEVNMPLLYGEGAKAFIRLQDEIAKTTNDLTLFAWQHVDETRSAKFRGIFAESPVEFARCANLRVPKEKFTLDNEFTLTNRGLRFDRNLAVRGPRRNFITDHGAGHDLIMGLDCLERSSRTNFTPKWVGIHLWRVGNTYVRYLADTLHYASSRTQWRSPEARTRVAYVPRVLSDMDAASIEQTISVSIVYDDVIRTLVDRDDIPTKRVLVGYGESDHVHEVDAFETQGLELMMRMHIFEAKLEHQTVRLALVCGLQVHPRSADGVIPWVVLFHEQLLSHLRDRPVSNPDMFNWRTTPALSTEEKLARFRDYIFETYSEASGYLNEEELGRTVEIVDSKSEQVIHTFKVEVEESAELMWEPTGPSSNFHVVLSYEQTEKEGQGTMWSPEPGGVVVVDVMDYLDSSER